MCILTTVENCFCQSANHCHPLSTQSREEEGAAGVKLWHKALAEVRSSAQLSLCIGQLQKSINWERSISKLVSETSILLYSQKFANVVSSFKPQFNERLTHVLHFVFCAKKICKTPIFCLLLQLVSFGNLGVWMKLFASNVEDTGTNLDES